MKGTLDGFGAGTVTAASDASVHRSGTLAGLAYITSAGRWHASAWTVPKYRAVITSGLAELRAAALLLTEAGAPDVLLSDSDDAVRYLQSWQRGEWRVPAAYQPGLERGHVPLLRAAFAIAASSPAMEIRHVHGHRGHLLNEAADSLARIAMHSDGSKRQKGHSADLAHSFLLSWQQAAPFAAEGVLP